MKKQFYPENVKELAMKKMRGLRQTGSVKEYVREYSSLMLEIPDMNDKTHLLYFMDGLQRWAEQELKRRGVQDLASAIATAESLVKFTNTAPKKDNKLKKGNFGKGGGDKPYHKASKPFKGKEKQGEPSREQPKEQSKGR